jgi:hypothetical protein
MQRRSSPLFQESQQIARSGDLGDVRLVNSWWYNNQTSINTTPVDGKLDRTASGRPTPHRPVRRQQRTTRRDHARQ